MFFGRYSRSIALQRQLLRSFNDSAATRRRTPAIDVSERRGFHSTRRLNVVVPVHLADIGEGIVECEIIQWFVEPGARVEQFSPLCEVQSDKASSEISSKYNGVVKKLYYEPGEMARVGKPFVDIDTDDVQGRAPSATPAPTNPPPAPASEPSLSSSTARSGSIPSIPSESTAKPDVASASSAIAASCASPEGSGTSDNAAATMKGKHAALATPAVRHMSKLHGIDISLISGTGKEGRVLKEDILRYVSSQERQNIASASSAFSTSSPTSTHVAQQQQPLVEATQALTPTQQHMFKTMTRSLTIPHFLYADEVDFSELTVLRSRLNKVLAAQAQAEALAGQQATEGSGAVDKLSYLPFIIKAVSLALYRYPILNARVDFVEGVGGGNGNGNGGKKPTLVHRSLHNIGVAMDTPAGLVVPVIRDVGSRNVLSIASELVRLQKAALKGKLSPADVNGGTITVSNIGNIGGTYVSPVIVEREVAILGIGRMRTVPAFGGDSGNQIVKKQVCNFSWSADHRVIDGATMARAAEVVRKVVEEPDVMVLHLR